MKDNSSSYLEQAAKNRTDIAEIKQRYDTGEIDRETAKQLAQPILDKINARNKEIAAKHAMKAYKIDFVSIMRGSY